MDNFFEQYEKLSKVAVNTANILNGFINELGLDGILEVVIIDDSLKADDKRKNRGSGITKIEKSPYINEINKMLIDGIGYIEISDFLRAKGVNISKSTIGRYAQKYFSSIKSNSSDKGGLLK